MTTVGVDLAAQPKDTGLATIDWSNRRAIVRELIVDADDDLIVHAVAKAEKAGIDCPFGWPKPFVTFISSHQDASVVIPKEVAGSDWRRRLLFRTTDTVIRRATGLMPLTVAADRIGHTALRCAVLLAQLALRDMAVDRAGGGRVVEVYPAASLKQWGLRHRRYKGAANQPNRNALVDELSIAAPWLSLGDYELVCRRSDHALDAVIAGLTARASFLGLATQPSKEEADVAAIEGWIALPTSSLQALNG